MNELKIDLEGEGLRIAIVQSRFNESVAARCARPAYKSCCDSG